MIRPINSIKEFHKIRGLQPPSHPLISLVDYGKTSLPKDSIGEVWKMGFYSIGLKRDVGKIRYGQQTYDFDEGILSFIAPGQVLSLQPNTAELKKASGWLLLIHEDYLYKANMHQRIKKYDFFDYTINEALFLSPKEEEKVIQWFMTIQQELENNMDNFSQNIILAQLDLFLNYAERYYQRQFLTRAKNNKDILNQFLDLLEAYFTTETVYEKGLPTVNYFATQLHISPSYLSSALKTATTSSAQQLIHEKLIALAKSKLANSTLSISEVAFTLGFEHSQSFSKLFKAKTKQTPSAFRASFYH
ncbi:helix-turn-helix domain-containing protein [Croceivirga sp. JEA036]|uniref:helix-turn-helix domain-containing protein n=1 Tax=Croceivirga sp. JEA036 TaxID=2721162 RepID=UPI001439D650|nr:response regulator transcription factor [Croceivirga sp. JEA036]NJB37853.1 helix-turn-helix transcriptional regulator [Croceivirga sp. JEA036]